MTMPILPLGALLLAGCMLATLVALLIHRILFRRRETASRGFGAAGAGAGAMPASVDATTRAMFEREGDGAGWDESFREAADPDVVSRAANSWGRVHWAKSDEDSPDYRHVADLPVKGATFQFGPDALELLIKANAFEPMRDRGKIIFGLRGCELVQAAGASKDDASKQVGRSALALRDARPDHQNFHCVIGVYDVAARKMSGFIASTVPCRQAIASYVEGGQPSNMQPTGCYRLVVGPHTGRIGCLREDEEYAVMRAPHDYVFDMKAVWDYKGSDWPQDDLHPAFANSSALFSSWGCQTVRGNCPKGTDQFSGEYKEFRHALGLLKPGTGDYGQRYNYVLLTGTEAAYASQLVSGSGPVSEADTARLTRLRHGSRGERVKALQAALGLATDGVLDAKVKKALADRQKQALGWADGIHSPQMDELLKFTVFAPPPAPAALAPAAPTPVAPAPQAPAPQAPAPQAPAPQAPAAQAPAAQAPAAPTPAGPAVPVTAVATPATPAAAAPTPATPAPVAPASDQVAQAPATPAPPKVEPTGT